MERRFRGYASLARLSLEGFPFGPNGKLATLWFDQLILQIPGEDTIRAMIEGKLHCSISSQKELCRIWLPLTKCLPNYEFLDNAFQSKELKMIRAAKQITYEELKKLWIERGFDDSSFPAGRGLAYTFARYRTLSSAALVDSIESWARLNEKSPCTFLPTLREQKILQEFFSRTVERKPFDLFSEFLIQKIPDLNSYSWDEIMKLRNHEFFNRFREKMVRLCAQLRCVPNTRELRSVFDEILRDDMEKMMNLFRPSPRLSAVKAVVSNIPLPIPINPLGIVFTAKELRKQIAASKKYGWLYFLIDLPKQTKTQNRHMQNQDGNKVFRKRK